MRNRRSLALGALLAVALSGCTSGGGNALIDLTETDPIFAGLDQAVVKEVLANPTASGRRDGLSPADQKSVAQGEVQNFILCRRQLSAYKSWISRGTAPNLPEKTVPTNPQPSDADMQTTYARVRSIMDSGDASQLRDDLVSSSGCGVWIPATPNDVNGATVATVVRGVT